MAKMEILDGIERRRRWSAEQKLAIVAETGETGVTVSEVARRHGLHPNQVFKWRLLARRGALAAPGFVPVVVDHGGSPVPEASEAPGTDAGHFEVRLGNGRVARFAETVSPERLRGLVRALEDG